MLSSSINKCGCNPENEFCSDCFIDDAQVSEKPTRQQDDDEKKRTRQQDDVEKQVCSFCNMPFRKCMKCQSMRICECSYEIEYMCMVCLAKKYEHLPLDEFIMIVKGFQDR